jgi:hypothetical protein
VENNIHAHYKVPAIITPIQHANTAAFLIPLSLQQPFNNRMNPLPLSPLDISKNSSSETEASDGSFVYTPASSSSDQEARCIVHEPLPQGGYSPSGERLIVESRVLQKSDSGKYWVDSTHGISEHLALRVSEVACMLVTQVRNTTVHKRDYIFGQVGLIKQGQDTILVTSLHNLVSENEHNGSDSLVAQSAFLRLSNGEDYDADFDALSSKTWKSDLESLNLRDGAVWSYGHDIAWGSFDQEQCKELGRVPALEAVNWTKEQYVSSASWPL